MNESIKRLEISIIDLISNYQPTDAVHALAKVLAAILYQSKKEGVSNEEIVASMAEAMLAEMNDFENWLKESN